MTQEYIRYSIDAVQPTTTNHLPDNRRWFPGRERPSCKTWGWVLAVAVSTNVLTPLLWFYTFAYYKYLIIFIKCRVIQKKLELLQVFNRVTELLNEGSLQPASSPSVASSAVRVTIPTAPMKNDSRLVWPSILLKYFYRISVTQTIKQMLILFFYKGVSWTALYPNWYCDSWHVSCINESRTHLHRIRDRVVGVSVLWYVTWGANCWLTKYVFYRQRCIFMQFNEYKIHVNSTFTFYSIYYSFLGGLDDNCH